MSTAAEPSPGPAEVLATPVQFLKGVGPQRAEQFARLGLFTARDVLFYFPRDYQDLSDVRAIDDLEEDLLQSVLGVVEDIDQQDSGFGKSRVGVLIRQGQDQLRAIWFNQSYMRARFELGQHVMFSGKPRFNGGRWQMSHPRVTWMENESDQPAGTILPVYSLTEGVAQYGVRNLVQNTLERFGEVPEEVFPESLLERYQLWPLHKALKEIHFPTDEESLQHARRRFIFQELYVLQLALALRRWGQRETTRSPSLATNSKIDARIKRLFPFDLTADQSKAIDEIAADMARLQPMNRLLQGDVGSGKTVAAVYAMLLCVAHGHQAVLMAPTEVLARQHCETLNTYLQAGRVRSALLTGALSPRERRDVVERIERGEVDLVIGTQAIVSTEIKFSRLGLVVIDEQHKFGVRQRAKLKQSGVSPHYLVMTATPIPRTMSMTMFGDLDVSTISESPPGRQVVNTYQVQPEQRDRWWEFVRKKLREGRQAFVIAPLVSAPVVEEADASETISEEAVNDAFLDQESAEKLEEELVEEEQHNVEELFETLSNGELEAFRLGLVHGRMSHQEKNAAMQAFHSGETQVLVATSVVEVGVNVPNATVMTILGAERFGLAQLHQLRGRVSRGHHAGFCGLISNAKTPESQQRLAALVESSDGFHLAEVDFRGRGPGDLFGSKQHGMPPLRIADLLRDEEVLQEAREAAQQLIAADPGMADEKHDKLRRQVVVRYGKVFELGDVG